MMTFSLKVQPLVIGCTQDGVYCMETLLKVGTVLNHSEVDTEIFNIDKYKSGKFNEFDKICPTMRIGDEYATLSGSVYLTEFGS